MDDSPFVALGIGCNLNDVDSLSIDEGVFNIHLLTSIPESLVTADIDFNAEFGFSHQRSFTVYSYEPFVRTSLCSKCTISFFVTIQ